MLLPIILGSIQIKNLNKYLIALLALVVSSGLSDLVVGIDFGYRDIAWPLYLGAQFFLISVIFLSVTDSRWNKIIVYISLIVFIVYIPVHLLIFGESKSLFKYLLTISVFLSIIMSISSFVEMYSDVKYENLFSYPFFWINVGILIYFSGNLFLTLSFSIFSMEKVYKLYLIIHNMLNGVKNLFFGAAFIIHFLETRKKSLV